MNLLTDAFRQNGKKAALVAFITAGFPAADSTAGVLRALADAGADVLEVGVPFSDPMADGAAIQRANARALANGMTLARVLQQVGDFRRDNARTPVVLMGYANSLVNFGVPKFLAAAADAGVNGVIVVDLADSDRARWRGDFDAANIALVPLIAPTTAAARARKIAENARGFIYLISLRGITGAANLDTAAVAESAAHIRAAAAAPLAVGFGVRAAADARAVAEIADGVVIGSRLIEIMEEAPDEAAARAAAFIRDIADALKI